MGLGFLPRTACLLPLTVLPLVLALAALGFRAGRRRGYGPFGVGIVAAAVLLLGKFALGWGVAAFGGLAGLVAASLWNSWPTRPTTGVPSASRGTVYQIGSIEQET
jgi:hypothetical protein